MPPMPMGDREHERRPTWDASGIDRNRLDAQWLPRHAVSASCYIWCAMNIRQDGERARYYLERKTVQEQAGNPIHHGVSEKARLRIMKEVRWRSGYRDGFGNWVNFMRLLAADCNRVFESPITGLTEFSERTLDLQAEAAETDEFLQLLELCAARIVQHRGDSAVTDLEVLQSVLADDLSAYRLVNVGTKTVPRIHVQVIDNPHLHAVLTDRTFELTRIAELAAAQNDYADAW